AERSIVVDDQQCPLGFGQAAQHTGYIFRRARAIGSVTLTHGICPWRSLGFPARSRGRGIVGADARVRSPRVRSSVSRLARFQEIATCAPPSLRLSKASRAPLRSSRLWAMKMPSPI